MQSSTLKYFTSGSLTPLFKKMLNFFFEIDANIIPILREQIHGILEQLKDDLVIEVLLPDNDPELTSCWKSSLVEELQADCRSLLSLLGHKSFGQEPISVEMEFAESFLRACSAVRRKLRTNFLAEIKDCDLERGELNIIELAPKLRKPYACYVFLAYIQETIIQSMQFA